MAMTVQLRLTTEDQIAFADSLKEYMHKSTYSQAFIHAAESFLDLRPRYLAQLVTITRLETEIARLNSVVEGARSAAALLLEKTSQGDLL